MCVSQSCSSGAPSRAVSTENKHNLHLWIYRRDDTEYAVTTFYPSHTTSSPGYRQSNATNHFPTNMATGYANPLGCTHNVVRRHIPFHYLLLQLKSFLSTSAAGRVEHIYAIRFFQGISESSTFVGTHYILGAYVSSLARRLDNYSCRCTLE